MPLLHVEGLTKRYESFLLDQVSFSLDPGYIMGFIGRNGAGKTTTLKCLMDLVKPDVGEVRVLGQDLRAHELAVKQRIGFALGDLPFYPRTPVNRLVSVYRRFYDGWRQAEYERYARLFDLDGAKRVEQLSAGMRVKLSLALALSHDAELLILDEPTSGLDPVSRDELLDVFRAVIEDGRRSILFSTHITSDLDKCADYITYIAAGRIVASATRDDFLGKWRIVKGTKDQLTDSVRAVLVGYKAHDFGFTGLVRAGDAAQLAGLATEAATIEDVMVFHERSDHGQGW
jgi:ABC-2 type transport system ATP-binding protein